MQRQRQLLLTEILVNPSVETEDEMRLSNQAKEIYGLLQLGPVTTSELAAIACQYNARVNEIRRALLEKGLTIDLTEKGEGGNNKYEIVNFEGSKYEAHLKKEGLI